MKDNWLDKEIRHCGLMVDLVTGEPLRSSETYTDEDEEILACPNPVRHCIRYKNPLPGILWGAQSPRGRDW